MIMVHIPEQMLRSGFDAVHAIPALCKWAADWLHMHGAVLAQHSRGGPGPLQGVVRSPDSHVWVLWPQAMGCHPYPYNIRQTSRPGLCTLRAFRILSLASEVLV